MSAESLRASTGGTGRDYRSSSLRESLVQHAFLGELLRELWHRGVADAEVLVPEVDAAGYDVVVECRRIVRHIQLKSMLVGGKRKHFDLQLKLRDKPSGCVLVFRLGEDATIAEYRWFGAAPGRRLPLLTRYKHAKHAKADATGKKSDRPNLRRVPLRKFRVLKDISEVATKLFGV